ncbi:hypothetical protein V8F20_005424 [Naviculisporaceae sp. PSN 640]
MRAMISFVQGPEHAGTRFAQQVTASICTHQLSSHGASRSKRALLATHIIFVLLSQFGSGYVVALERYVNSSGGLRPGPARACLNLSRIKFFILLLLRTYSSHRPVKRKGLRHREVDLRPWNGKGMASCSCLQCPDAGPERVFRRSLNIAHCPKVDLLARVPLKPGRAEMSKSFESENSSTSSTRTCSGFSSQYPGGFSASRTRQKPPGSVDAGYRHVVR